MEDIVDWSEKRNDMGNLSISCSEIILEYITANMYRKCIKMVNTEYFKCLGVMVSTDTEMEGHVKKRQQEGGEVPDSLWRYGGRRGEQVGIRRRHRVTS